VSLLLVALGAAVGAPLRWWCDRTLDRYWPTGTLLVNVVGSALVGASAAWGLSHHLWALVVTGFCGALTTYSGFAVQAVDAGPLRGTVYAVATAVGSVVACLLGFLLAV